MNDALDRAVELVSLPALIRHFYPDARIGDRGGLIHAPHRTDRDPSFSVFRGRKGFWLWKDHATGEGGTALAFLIRVVGMEKGEAARFLKRFVGLPDEGGSLPPPPRPAAPPEPPKKEALTDKERRLLRWGQGVLKRQYPEYLKARGIPQKVAVALGLGASPEGDVFIPIRNPEGKFVALKKRAAKPGPRGRYHYLEQETGSPWLYLPGFKDEKKPVLVVEGEVNAIAAWAAARDLYAVVGSAGASTPVDHPEAFKGRLVLIYADGDEAGKRAREAWSQAIAEAGGTPLPLPPLPEGDFGDLAGNRGLAALRRWLLGEEPGSQEEGAAEVKG